MAFRGPLYQRQIGAPTTIARKPDDPGVSAGQVGGLLGSVGGGIIGGLASGGNPAGISAGVSAGGSIGGGIGGMFDDGPADQKAGMAAKALGGAAAIADAESKGAFKRRNTSETTGLGEPRDLLGGAKATSLFGGGGMSADQLAALEFLRGVA